MIKINVITNNIAWQSYIKNPNNFIEKTTFIIDNPHDTDEYDFTMKKGGMLIFDEAGVHRGAQTLLTERLVARFVYSSLSS